MIRAVFLDFYDTIVTFDPPREELQVRACQEFGVKVDPSAIPYGYWVADDFMSRENARLSLQRRSRKELQDFWANYEATLLRNAGIDVSGELALKIVTRLRALDRKLALFDDVVPALTNLKRRGVLVGLISNLNHDLDSYCESLGLTRHVDFAVTSFEAGAEKPHPPIFLAALERAAAGAHEAIHVGDQYQSDVVGARTAGINPILLDRHGFWRHVADCPRVATLAELPDYL
jgi:putative hydrolase of the HAD superfamily